MRHGQGAVSCKMALAHRTAPRGPRLVRCRSHPAAERSSTCLANEVIAIRCAVNDFVEVIEMTRDCSPHLVRNEAQADFVNPERRRGRRFDDTIGRYFPLGVYGSHRRGSDRKRDEAPEVGQRLETDQYSTCSWGGRQHLPTSTLAHGLPVPSSVDGGPLDGLRLAMESESGRRQDICEHEGTRAGRTLAGKSGCMLVGLRTADRPSQIGLQASSCSRDEI